MPIKKCEMCGSEFQARLSKIRTCSIRCRNTLISTEKSAKCQHTNRCVVCGDEFHVGADKANRQTCSVACGYKLRGSITSKSIEMKCVTCGTGFLTRLSQLKGIKGGGKYCSKPCLYSKNDKLTQRDCIQCGKQFKSPPSQMHVKTCSTECGYEYFSGAQHARYIGATKKVVHEDGTTTTVATRWYAAKTNKERYETINRARPAWANENRIKEIYESAARLEELTGQKYHVDHIVPLKGKTVSGLHNEFNLQIIPWRNNLSKGNRHWPDKP